MPARPELNADFLAFQEALAGRYSLERELGRGGMGIVYLAHDIALDRPVALKLLPAALAAQPALRARFIREARIAARLSHPNIVPIHLVDEVGPFVFFVMPFVEGETLGERVRKRGPVPAREATGILREVAWALAYAHAQGVVHRDIKADNILLEAGSGRALVTDFGIARAGAAGEGSDEGEVVGTPEYMSPEQARGGDVDARSDLYALGVVAHYILSGRLPFEAPTPHATLALQLTSSAPGLASLVPDVPRALAEAVDRCLEKSPAARIQGGEELADVLGRVLQERREVPAAIRIFQEQTREFTGAIVGVSMLFLMSLTLLLLLAESGEPLTDMIPGFLVSAALMVPPFALLGVLSRRLLKAGYDRDELVRALRRDLDDRRRELASQLEEETAADRWAPRLGWAGLGVVILSTLALLSPSVPDGLIQLLLGVGIPLGIGGAAVTAIRHTSRKVPGDRWLRFWESGLGKGIFGLAGLGLRAGEASGGAFRPTELAIGMAAERLFEELPEDVKGSLADVPGVLKLLERHGESTRARVEELDRVLLEIGRHETRAVGGATSAGQRESVAEEVRRKRDRARDRLREVAAAIERLRLELLRLHAGSGDVPNLTLDLAAARALADDAEHLARGRREIDALLGIAPPLAEKADTPQPA